MKRIIPILILILMVAPAAALNDDAWPEAMEDWDHRVPITITDPPADGVQRMVTVTFQEGMQADFDDVRMYTSSGSAIDYWIEDYTASTSADVWFEQPSTDTYVYVYYDNAAVENASNGPATFDYFDPCTSTDGWTGNTAQISIEDGELRFLDGGSSAYGVEKSVGASFAAYDVIFEARIKMVDYSTDFALLITEDGGISHRLGQITFNEASNTWGYGVEGGTLVSGHNHDYNIWQITYHFSASKVDYAILNDTRSSLGSANTIAYAYGSPTEFDLVRFHSGSLGRYCDLRSSWILIRKYDSAATTFSLGTPEEPEGSGGAIPFPGYVDAPTDPDTDGLYEDCNANGRVDFNDLMIFFQYNAWAQANQPNITYFDWSGNGKIEFSDVVQFWYDDY